MSHFTVMVIGKDPEIQLEPYDENIQVSPYSCGVVSNEDQKRMIEYYERHNPEHKGKSFNDLYKIFGKEWDGGACKKNADGDWEEWSSYNPKSKWDWYKLGGRWSGLIKLKKDAEGVKGKSGVFNNEVGIDQAYKGDIANLDELSTFAVVKDGIWYERGEMGWWACVTNEKEQEDWDGEIHNLIKDLPDDTLISIYDCHI